MRTEKGASEVIVIILIIVVTVILATLFFAWLRESSKTKLDETSFELRQASDFSCMDASFIIESCNLISVENNSINFVLSNNSTLVLFNIVLSIHGKNKNNENTSIIGRFENIVSGGETVLLSTDTDFTFIQGDQAVLDDLNISTITNITLTNGTCPNKIVSLNCDAK